MSLPANTPQAHAPPAYLYPQSNLPNAAPQPRSSSLPFLMGLNQSKPTPPTPSPTPSSAANVAAAAASKGFTAAVAGGIKLKRAFAARRKKSEDATSLFTQAKSPNVPPSYYTSSPQVADPSSSSARRLPPPTSPPHSTYPPTVSQASTPTHTITPAASQLTNLHKNNSAATPISSSDRGTPDAKTNMGMNRNSVIPLSPGISSAVNYMTMFDHPSLPPLPLPLPSPSPSILEKDETERDKERESRQSKESRRKSDSTNSHHTIRASASRNSRPVSWAESFQSAFTVVPPPGGSSPRSRPLSALVQMGDGEFSMVELEEEEGESDGDEQGMEAPDRSRGVLPIMTTTTAGVSTALPPVSMMIRRSTSLDLAAVVLPVKGAITTVVTGLATTIPSSQITPSVPAGADSRHVPQPPSQSTTESLTSSLSSTSSSSASLSSFTPSSLSESASQSDSSQPRFTPSSSVHSSASASNNSTAITGTRDVTGNSISISGQPQSQTQTHGKTHDGNSSAPTSTTQSLGADKGSGVISAGSSTSMNTNTNANTNTSTGAGAGLTPIPNTSTTTPLSAVNMHNERVLPSLPSSSSSSSSSGVKVKASASMPSSVSGMQAVSSASTTAARSYSQQQQRILAQQLQQQQQQQHPLQPVRQQMSMPTPQSGSQQPSQQQQQQQQQQRQYDYQYPLQFSPPPQHPHPQQHHQHQPRAQTISLSSPSSSPSHSPSLSPSPGPGSAGSGMGTSMHSAAAGLAKRAVEKMGIGRKWAMGVGIQMGIGSGSGGASSSGANTGGYGGRSTSAGGGESDRERGGRNGSTSSGGGGGGGGGRSAGTGNSTSGYTSSSGGSMFEAEARSPRSGRSHSNSLSNPISNQGQNQKYLNGPVKHVQNRSRHGGAGSVSSVSTDSHGGSDAFGGPSSFGSASGSSGAYQQGDGPMLGVKLRTALVSSSSSSSSSSGNMPGMRSKGMTLGGLVFKRDLSAGVRDTGIWVGRGSSYSSSYSSSGGRDAGNVTGARQAQTMQQGGGVGVGGAGRGKGKNIIADLETRKLPALVVRCAQHLLLWGIQEEGLFRVSGMPQHVARLRAEFDLGADYDMAECTPGDLDPHAVASVFKAYLRELPEPILTQKLQPLFDAAVNKETNINTAAAAAAAAPGGEPLSPTKMRSLVGTGGHHPGLPSGPKSGFNAPSASSSSSSYSAIAMSAGSAVGGMALRKAPSLSTFAMPTFTGIPPPSPALTASFQMLISQLPQENRDLVRTVVDLIKATARESKETKMPLSNLLLVFCPSLNMTPPLLKVLCEAEGIWGDEEVDEEDEHDVLDIRRRTVVPTVPETAPTPASPGAEDVPPPLPAKDDVKSHVDEDAKSTADTEEEGSVISGRASLDTNTTDNNLSSDYHASAEDGDDDGSSMFDGEDRAGAGVLRSATAIRSRRRRPPHVQRQEVVPASARDSEVPTVYLDSRSYCSTASSASSLVQSEDEEDNEGDMEADAKSGDDERDGEGEGEITPGANTFFNQQLLRDPARDDAFSVSSGGDSINNMPISSPPPLSSSAESVATPTSSGNPSFTHLSSSMGGDGMEKGDLQDHQHEHDHEHERSSNLHPHIVETAPLGLKSRQSIRRAPPIDPPLTTSGTNTTGSPRPVQFPSSPTSPYYHFPYPEQNASTTTTTKNKRRSIPLLSLPSFSPSITPLLPSISPAPSSAGSVGSAHSVGFPVGGNEKTLRAKKPSLKLLFSKRSASSLTSIRDSKGISFISNPVLQTQGQGQQSTVPLSATSAIHSHRNSPKSASDSSVSTPLSAVTAPQSSSRSVSANGTMHFPPVLDTPIDDGTLGIDYGSNPSPPNTATLSAPNNEQRSKECGTTAEAEDVDAHFPPVQRRAVVGRGAQQRSAANQQHSTEPLSAEKKKTAMLSENDRSPNSLNRLRPQASSSNLSIVSTASSHHLSLFEEDDDENVEDWTKSVLLAADVDGEWGHS